MIRTRDFLLFLLSVGFLVLAITVTIVRDGSVADQGMFVPAGPIEEAKEYEVSVSESETIDRQARILALRARIEAMNEQQISAEPPVIEREEVESEEIDDDAPTSTDESLVVNNTVQRCQNYQEADIWWPATDVRTVERESARIVYLGSGVPVEEVTTIPEEDILIALPVRAQPVSQPSCLASDVVGIALDGSLIRNSDYTAYQVFESFTLIGYALDGFPIYGVATPDIETDACGGAMVGTTYRYYLSPERDGMIGCFAGVPTRL